MKRMVSMAIAASVVAATALVSVKAEAATITTLFNTGVDGSGAGLPNGTIGDPHYSLLTVPGGSTSEIRVITAAGGFPIPPYFEGGTSSAWIGPNNAPTLESPAGTYVYRTTFDLTGFNAATASISGGWSSDNDGLSILLNGVDTGNPSTSFTQFSEGFAAFSIASGFLSGLNTLDFIVNNGGGPTSLRVEMSGTADLAANNTPIPGALPLFATGLGAFGLLGWRRKRKGSAVPAA